MYAEAELPAFWVDDVPADPFDVQLDEEGDFTAYLDVEVLLLNPLRVAVPGLTATRVGSTITVNWPGVSPFAVGGLYKIYLILVGLDARAALEPLPVVVETQGEWLSLASTRRDWLDAPDDDTQLFILLESAKRSILAYAPELEGDEPFPLAFQQAQLMQTRAQWNSFKTGSQDEIGGDGQTVRVYPLDKNIRQLLRPKTVLPGMW